MCRGGRVLRCAVVLLLASCSNPEDEIAQPCTSNDDCEGFLCENGKCRSSCQLHSDCNDGYTCDAQTGRCTIASGGCTTDDECGPYACRDEKCLDACGSGDDCSEGYHCDPDGVCVADDPGELLCDGGVGGTVQVGELYTLHGVAVTPDGSATLTHDWTQLSGPAVTFVESEPSSPDWIFEAPLVAATTDLSFQLEVTADTGQTCTTEAVVVTVIAGNHPPRLEPIANPTLLAGDTLELVVTATDPDGDNVTVQAFDLPSGATFDDDTSSLVWTPSTGQVGTHEVILMATDDGDPPLGDMQAVILTVVAGQGAPVIALQPDRQVREGQALSFGVAATDPEGGAVTWSAEGLPDGASFDEATGTLSWTPTHDQSGVYVISFTATDDGDPPASAVASAAITVTDVNRPPVLEPIGDLSVRAHERRAFPLRARDPDGDPVALYAGRLPDGFQLRTTAGGKVGELWFDTYDERVSVRKQATIVAVDQGDPSLSASETISITIEPQNRPPELQPIPHLAVGLEERVEFTVRVWEPDGDRVVFRSPTADELPEGAEFRAGGLDDEGYAVGTFTWTPAKEQLDRVHEVPFVATDDAATPLQDEQTVSITVGNANRPPELLLTPGGAVEVEEGAALEITVAGRDADGDRLRFEAADAPAGSEFKEQKENLWGLYWTPGCSDGQDGTHEVTFTVSDDGAPAITARASSAITVLDVNRPPKLEPVEALAVREGEEVRFTLRGTDADVEAGCDGDELLYVADGLPPGATLDPDTGEFSWVPGSLAGDSDDPAARLQVHRLTAVVIDQHPSPSNPTDALTGETTVEITVRDVNRPPLLELNGPTAVRAGDRIELTVSAVDPDGQGIVFPMPEPLDDSGGTFCDAVPDDTCAWSCDEAAGSCTLAWTPAGGSALATHTVTLAAGDDYLPEADRATGTRELKLTVLPRE